MINKLDWKEEAALKVFESHKIVRFQDLPNYLGLGTMERLVEKGLVIPIDLALPTYSKSYGWKLARPE